MNTSDDTPLALKLAQMLDDTHQHPVIAAELRRLHDEIEGLKDGDVMLCKIGAICRGQELYTGGYDEILQRALEDVKALHYENEALRHDLKTEAVLSFRKQVEWMESKQEKDTALLRQALGALDYHCTRKPGHEQPMYELWEALRERLGDKCD